MRPWRTPKLWSPITGGGISAFNRCSGACGAAAIPWRAQQPPLQGPGTEESPFPLPPCTRRKVAGGGTTNLLLLTHDIFKPLETPGQSGQPLGKEKEPGIRPEAEVNRPASYRQKRAVPLNKGDRKSIDSCGGGGGGCLKNLQEGGSAQLGHQAGRRW